ncbi:hypothetical protein [Dyadobacter luticola]|uniref:DUF3592 domain-containing protein n=1 Tax=Dyadobacter luticola TaxID=1979387 RepID=A0A5R9L5X0_9BACT|nr:hypothetical protein [Dyadobacter luticola]TLV03956.1 hypothetical protein FEN17_10345 [Dyadobacter luticola]
MTIRRSILAGCILLFSFFGIYGSMGENKFISFVPFLLVVVASLVLYQSFDSWIPDTAAGILGFFIGRLVFVGLILYVNAQIFYSVKTKKIEQDGVSTYGIATDISSRYLRSRRDFYRNFTYVANGKVLQSKVRFSYDLKQGDTLYLRYSKSNPYLIEFENNAQNRKHGILK